jgi:hypothetical protein
MICPILFIRKPEEAECLKEHCSFWVKGETLGDEVAVPERFTAVITGPVERHLPGRAKAVSGEGKCAILAIAEAAKDRNE